MSIGADVVNQRKSEQSLDNKEESKIKPLRIVVSPPEFKPLQQVLRGEPESATYIIQGYVSRYLTSHGHEITYLAPYFNLSQIVYTNDYEVPEIAERSWSTSWWFKITSKTIWRLQRVLGIPYLNIFSNFRLFDACLRYLPGHDIVYERNGLYKFGVAMACKRLKLPYILYFEADDVMEHDTMDKPITGLLRWQAKNSIRYNLNAADTIICVTEAGKNQLVTNWNIPADKIVVFPNVADIHKFKPDTIIRTEVRTELGYEDQPLIVFVGNFYKWHDVETLLDAFAKVLVSFPQAYLLLVGDGDEREEMIKRAAELDINKSTLFTGLVAHEEIPRLLAAADIGVVPYPPMETELWLSPLKLYEYMASGLTIIASDVGQISDVINDGRNGMLVPPGDASALAGKIIQLIGDPKFSSRLGGQAREDAVNRHSWEHYMTRLERLFDAVVERNRLSTI